MSVWDRQWEQQWWEQETLWAALWVMECCTIQSNRRESHFRSNYPRHRPIQCCCHYLMRPIHNLCHPNKQRLDCLLYNTPSHYNLQHPHCIWPWLIIRYNYLFRWCWYGTDGAICHFQWYCWSLPIYRRMCRWNQWMESRFDGSLWRILQIPREHKDPTNLVGAMQWNKYTIHRIRMLISRFSITEQMQEGTLAAWTWCTDTRNSKTKLVHKKMDTKK